MDRIRHWPLWAWLLLSSPSLSAQSNLGSYYQNMYLQTHMAMNFLQQASPALVNRPAARLGTITWTNRPSQSALIRQLVANSPVAQRSQVQTILAKLMQVVPTMVQKINQQSGATAQANNTADLLSIAGVLAYQLLTGKELSNAQFAGQLQRTRSNLLKRGLSPAQSQITGEQLALSIGWLGVLEDNRQSQPLRQFAQQVFTYAYGASDPTRFQVTEQGLSQVR